MRRGFWAVLLLLFAIVIYYSFDPNRYHLFPRCPFFVITGLKCPGCGSQRAVHSLLHFDLLGAIRYNALLVFSIPILLVLFYAEAVRKRKPAFYAAVNRPLVIWTYFSITVVWWVIRNILGF
jgi:hypothetical protein